jgi:two-component system sensor histidine kinase MprB
LVNSKKRPRKLVTRVVLATATVAAIAGIVGASLASAVAYYFLRHDEDSRLSAAAEHARYEFIRDGAESNPASLAHLLSTEEAELASDGLSIAVISWDGGSLGSYQAGPVPAGTCRDRRRKSESFRACGVAWGSSLVVVASADSSVSRFRQLGLLATLVAALSSMLLGIMVSRRVSRSALGPLTRLHERVVRLPAVATSPELGPDEDVLEVDALRHELGRLLRRQAEVLERSRNFSADAAHELRTPLTTLRAKVDILVEEMTAGGLRREMSAIQAEVTRLADIVERLLVLAMPEEDALANARPLSVVDLLEELVAALPAPSRARLDVTGCVPDAGIVRADAPLLELAIANVIDNALKYSSGPVLIRTIIEGERLVLEVEDDGPGIPEHERAALFQPFHRGAATRHVRGHGIGLAMVAKVISEHGGTVTLEGERGLRVRMILPCLQSSS